MELKLNFKEAAQLINERNHKNLFLFLLLPWMLSVVASFSATSQGIVFIIDPSTNVNDSWLGFIFNSISSTGTYIIVVAICNFLTELILFWLAMAIKYKFAIKKSRVVSLLLTGHLIAILLYSYGSINQNTHAIVLAVVRLFILASSFYIILRFLPKKYLEILVPYSAIFTAFEVQALRRMGNKPVDNRVAKNSKRRLEMYTKALLLAFVKDKSETALIELLKKQRAIDEAKSKETKKAIQDLANYLQSSFKVQIPPTEIVFEYETQSERLLRQFISSLDTFSKVALFTTTQYSIILDLTEKMIFPISQDGTRIPPSYDTKNLKRLITYHLDRARKVDAVSAQQKISAVIFTSFLSLIFPTVLYILRLKGGDSSSIPSQSSLLLFFQYFSTLMVANITSSFLLTRYRRAGVDVVIPNRYLIYLLNTIQFLIFFAIMVSTEESIYKLIISVLLQNIVLLYVGIAIFQLLFLFMSFKPPAELRKASIASSLLVRELLLLRSQALGAQSLASRKQVGRYIYFAKKYLNLIVKNLISVRFDAHTQKTQLREYFASISEYLDNLGAQIKLGGEKNRVGGTDQIERLILYAAIEDFGEIPNAIPEFRRHLELKSIQPKPPSLARQIFQALDTSATARTILIILVFILINLINPSWWVYIQNISSLFEILTP